MDGVFEASAIWRRLEPPGHDACRLMKEKTGWCLEGCAVFLESQLPAFFSYRVACDKRWITSQGEVQGWGGGRPINWRACRGAAGRWTLNGEDVPAVGGCLDLDLDFTPATNLLALRRLKLEVGESAEVTSAWLDSLSGLLRPMPQRYERRSEELYWYEAPLFGYCETLAVTAPGFVRLYPGLWQMEE